LDCFTASRGFTAAGATDAPLNRPGGAGGHSLRRTLRAATKLPPGTAQHREGALSTSLHAHALRRRPGYGLLRDLADEAVDTSASLTAISTTVEKLRASMEGLEGGLLAQVNALDSLLEVAVSRQAPWQRPIATRVARGKGL